MGRRKRKNTPNKAKKTNASSGVLFRRFGGEQSSGKFLRGGPGALKRLSKEMYDRSPRGSRNLKPEKKKSAVGPLQFKTSKARIKTGGHKSFSSLGTKHVLIGRLTR